MNVELLCLTVALLSSPLLTLCDPLFVLSAPNLLRVGSSENVFVEAQDYSGGDLNVKIIVKNHPHKTVEILSESVKLTAANNYQLLASIKIPDDKNYFIDDPLEKQYVYLQAQFPSQTLEKVVMVSFQSGYIFVQTDKPIYTPASTVQYRIFSLTPNLHPLSQSGISVEIMNPQGLTVTTEKVFPAQGMKSGYYIIPDVASPGIWKVVTRYANTPQKTFTADFEVKEYVLPTFEVILTPSKSFFYVGDESLTVDISAEYLFGQKVDGQAFVVFGVMDDERKLSIPASLRTVPLVKGKGTADLTREMIIQTFPDINQLIGKSIYVSVSVLTETGSEMVEAQRRGIQIVTSPYTIHFMRTPQFFKPGMPFDVSVYVTNPDQTPAENVKVEVNPGGVRGRTKANGIVKVTINTPGRSSTLDITVKTRDPQLEDKQQAVKKMTAQAYKPKGGSNNYLHIGIDAAELEVGDQMKVNLNLWMSPGVGDQKDLTYMITSKGQIVKADRFKSRGQSLVILSLPVTKEMVPSFRFVAYYHVGSSEVVSDSVWVDVKDTCMGTLNLQVMDKVKTYKPGDEFSLQITGDPGAKVGLVVVDKAVHVLNKNRLTQSKIWDVIEKHDTGCTAGSGKDSMGVFYDAGLMFESSTAGGTNIRTRHECPTSSGRRRRTEESGSLLAVCGRTSHTDTRIVGGQDASPAAWPWQVSLHSSNSYLCGGSLINDEWVLTAAHCFRRISSNITVYLGRQTQSGSNPHEVSRIASQIITHPEYSRFTDDSDIALLRLSSPVKFSRYIKPVCLAAADSSFFSGTSSWVTGWGRTATGVVPAAPQDLQEVEVPVVGNRKCSCLYAADSQIITNNMICAGAEGKDSCQGDSGGPMVSKQGSVWIQSGIVSFGEGCALPDFPGVYTRVSQFQSWINQQITHNHPGFITFTSSGTDSDLSVNCAAVAAIPATPAPTIHTAASSADSDEIVSRTQFPDSWLWQEVTLPDCKDKNCVTAMSKPRIYLKDSSTTWQLLAISLSNTYGICVADPQEIVVFKTFFIDLKMPYSAVRNEQLEIKAILHNYTPQKMKVHVEFMGTENVCSSASKKGKYTTVVEVDRFSTRSVPYVIIPMKVGDHQIEVKAEASDLVTDGVKKHLNVVHDGQKVIKIEKKMELNPAKMGGEQHEVMRSYIPSDRVPDSPAYTYITVTAEKRTHVGQQDINLDLLLSLEGRSRPIRWNIRKDNAHITRSVKISLYNSFNVTARGIGTASLSVLTLYYAKPPEKSAGCEHFDLTVRMNKESVVSHEGAIDSYMLTLEFFYKSQSRDATITILDVGLLTGFIVDERDLTELAAGKDRYIQKYETDQKPSERGSLLIYLEKVSHTQVERIVFRMHKMNKVGLLQPARVTVYEYYSPDARCTKYYHPEREDGALIRLCQGDVCQCAEENCSYQIKYKVQEEERFDKACEVGMDYVYKVIVVGMKFEKHSDVYNMKVDQVLKEGIDQDLEGQMRAFLAHPNCRESLGLKEGKSYLIMGKIPDLLMGRLQYILGEQTWIEYWPTREESQTPEHRDRYLGISVLADNLLRIGCTI